jgi:hypothetical protein
MTEEEWFAWSDPYEFLGGWSWRYWELPRPAFSGRKLRLFAVACARCVSRFCESDLARTAIGAAEESADARTNEQRVRLKLHRIRLHEYWGGASEQELACALVRANPYYAAITTAQRAIYFDSATKTIETVEQERHLQGSLLRDIVGNPFRPVAFSPAWRTSTAVALARQMYDSREFGAMPILADALQDAGCEDEAILNHCRDANQPHVRGCWVVDLVLGKEWPYSVPRR